MSGDVFEADEGVKRGEMAKLEWLRLAAKEGFDSIKQGDCSILISDSEVTALIRQIHDEVKAELRVG